MAMWLALVPDIAFAASRDLRRDVCTAVLPDGASDAEITGASYRCGDDAPTDGQSWLWLKLDPTQLADLPPGWELRVDQTRFERIAVLVVEPDGSARITRGMGELEAHWAPGGLLAFEIEPAGREITGLYLGFRHIDDLSLMRKIIATTAAAESDLDTGWLLLMGLFAGTLLSALLYNIVISTGVRYAFQRWYLLWVGTAFVYGMVWTNMAGLLIPGFIGPMAVRLDFVLVGLMVATGNMFFLTVIERGKLPRWLIWAGRLLAACGALLGFMAALDMVFPPVLTDRLLNLVIAATAIVVALSSWVAVRRGSRVVWFYLIGWGPVICVFLARLARNLGLTPQHDLIDMATYAALAFEALVLSLAIADRFRRVRQELESARRRRAIDAAEAQTLRVAAQTDFLTGLGNRAAFHVSADDLIDRSEPFSLFLVDVDHLKAVNDRYGHAGGDALLCEVAAALAQLVKAHEGTHVARIGGDEFAILSAGDLLSENAVAASLGELQGKPWRCFDRERMLSLSIGSARFPDDATRIDLLHQNADLALYNAKRFGRARYFRYDPLQRVLRDLQTGFADDADAALQRDEFRLHFQPIVALSSGAVCGYEAQLQWDHPDHGLMEADRFADVLEADRIGLLVQEHMLELALGWLGEQREPIGTLGVNVTAAQLVGSRAAQHVLDRLAHHGVPPWALCIEVTEGALLERSAEAVLATLQTLHDAGICIALDRFGTGLASLTHLRRMPVDRIKIDSSFIAGIDQPGGKTLAVVSAIIGLARGLGKVLVAEGVETEAQARRLTELGCQLAQGPLYSPPAPTPLVEGSGPTMSGLTDPAAVTGARSVHPPARDEEPVESAGFGQHSRIGAEPALGRGGET